MIQAGDTLIINTFKFTVSRLTDARVGLSYTDKNGVTHIKWIDKVKVLNIIKKVA